MNGAGLWTLEPLATEVATMLLIPTTERRIEARHAITHRSTIHRRVTPAYVSLQLRMPGWESSLKRQRDLLQQTVECFERARKVRRLVHDLGLSTHPQLSAMLADKKTRSCDLWRILAAVLYSDDPANQFANLNKGRQVNRRHKESLQKQVNVTGGIPRCRRPSWQLVVETAQLDHFRQTALAGRVYSLPAAALEGDDATQLVPLREKLGRAGEPLDQRALMDLGADANEAVVSAAPDAGPRRLFFSIINATPSKARVIPLPAAASSKLGPDDMQVALHVDYQAISEAEGCISVGAAQVASNPVMVLSRLGALLADDPEQLLSWKVRGRLQYCFSGIPLNSEEVELVTQMVVSGAMPSTGQQFCCQRDSTASEILSRLEALGHVASSGADQAGLEHWVFTGLGMRALEP